jgi:mono/diheme cytochrome c family protein
MRTGRLKSLPLLFLASATPVMAQEALLPAGPGRDETLKACGGCHGVDTFTGIRRSDVQWSITLDSMINWGAKISDGDYDTVLAYLTTWFGPAPRPKPATPPAP